MSKEYVNQVATGIITQLREGTAPWIRPWRPGERYLPHNPISGHQYRGINVVWLMVRGQERGYLDTRWMTYRQAESVGAQVRRGEKGTGIQYWKWEGTRPIVDDSGRTRVNEQGHPQTERVQYARPRVFTAVVFNADQIEGLAPAASTGTQPPEWERHERAEGLLQASGVPILHRPGERAYYSLDSDHIVLPARSQFPTADNYYAVALHEVGHSTGHPSRLNRDMGHPFGSEQYAREELRAEIASLMMGDELSIGHDPGQHIAYVGSWIKALQNDPLEVFRAAAAAEKMQTYVLGLAQQQTAQQEQPRSHSMTRGDRMDPDIVADTLNHELEPHGLQVFLSKSETSPGFELHRPDGSAVLVPTGGTDQLAPKRFDWKTTSTEILAWWARHQVVTTSLQAPVALVLNDTRRSFRHFHDHEGAASPDATLEGALRWRGLSTVADVVGPDEARFFHRAVEALSPVFGLKPTDQFPYNAYLERKGLADAFVLVAEKLVVENVLDGDLYVLTTWKNEAHQKVREYASVVSAVRALKGWNALESPSIYLKARDDADFDSRLTTPKDWTDWRTIQKYRGDSAAHSLVHIEWFNDGSDLRYVSPIPELALLVNARPNDDLERLNAAAVDAIEHYKLTQLDRSRMPEKEAERRGSVSSATEQPSSTRGVQDGDRYVIATKHPDTDAREKQSEHASLIEAIGRLKEWDMHDRPALYFKARDDLTFDSRFANPKEWPYLSRATARDDPSWAPLIWGHWNEDETGIIYVSPIPELEELARAKHGGDLDQLTSEAIGAIARYNASHHHTGQVDESAARVLEATPSEQPNIATKRVNLMVPYPERDQANNAGAHWDKIARTWYAPPGADLDALARWRRDPSAPAPDAIPVDPRQEFAAALRDAGLALDGEPDMDGVLHRVRVESDHNGQRSGAYVGYLDGHPAGFIQNYKTGLRTNWKSQNTVHSASDVDRQRLQEEAAARLAERQRRRMEHQEDVAVRARRALSTAPVAPDNHRYLTNKGFSDNVDGLRQDQFGNLLVPAHDIDGTVWSFQRISEGGDKGFLKGGRIEGCHALLMGEHGGIKNSDRGGLYIEQTVLIVVEGYATARTMRRATGLPVAAAFSSGNLLAVAQAYRNRFPDLNIIIAGDNDHRKPLERGPDGRPKKNVGKETAEAAAAAVGGYALLPPFATEEHGTDSNDLEQLRGREAALTIIKDGVTVALVNIDAQRIAAGLRRFPVHHREADLERPSGPELGYVVAPTLGEARDKLRRGEWVATQSRATISAPQVDVFDSDSDALDRERADAQRTIERDRLRLADARGTGHNGESVAETLRLDEATAQRAETPAQARAALDMIREAAEGEAEQQVVHDQRRERRHSRAR